MGRVLDGEAPVRRYWLVDSIFENQTVTIQGDEFHHIMHVCRQDVGSKFEVLADGKAYLVEVTSVAKKSAEARVLEERVIPDLPRPHLHLCLSVSRFPVMEAVIEKCVELGVKSVRPFFSEFSFVGASSGVPDNKWERWRRIITMATQQCGRGELMELHPAVPLQKMLPEINRSGAAWGLFAYEGSADQSLDRVLAARQPKAVEDVYIFVGSEGGFSQREVEELFVPAGLPPVTMGAQVLRVETACVALVSVLKYELGLMV